MQVALYFDVHVPHAISDQLRRRGIDVRLATIDQSSQLSDDELLERAAQLNRVVFTFDVRFKAMAEDWQRIGREFAGLIYAHPMHTSIGQLVLDLELIAKATDFAEWRNRVEHLPF
jgi:hypothetical protein